MSNAYLSPILQDAQFADDGTFLSGGLIWFYVAGTSTPIVAYTGPDASTAWSNPIELNSRGETGGEIWLLSGSAYKMVLEGPPIYGEAHGPVISTFDNITGVNDPGTTTVQNWVVFSGTPTYISTTSFTVSGDQRSIFLKSRRLKTTNTGGTVYSTVVSASYATSQTTVVVSNDYGQSLDAGLSAISYGFIETGATSSIPVAVNAGSAAGGSQYQMWIDYDGTNLKWAKDADAASATWPVTATKADAASGDVFATQTATVQAALVARCSGVNEAYLFNTPASWGVLSSDGGVGIQYNRSTSKFLYGGFTLPTPGVSSGYFKLPNGMIVQYGTGTASNAGTNVTFPTAFVSGVIAVAVTQKAATHLPVSWEFPTTTKFTAYCGTTENITYIAIGV